MIDIHLHWAWLLMAAVVIVGICTFWYYEHDDDCGPASGIRTVFGLAILIVCVLVALVLGGIFIW